MNTLLRPLAFVALLAPAMSWAQSVEAPRIEPGHRWVYAVTVEASGNPAVTRKVSYTVSRAASGDQPLTLRTRDGNPAGQVEYANADWSRSVSMSGKPTVIARPFDFPMSEGKTWKLGWDDDRIGPMFKGERNDMVYRVVGWEEVKVPAGNFRALKIEATGAWTREFSDPALSATRKPEGEPAQPAGLGAPRAPNASTGQRREVYWYAPEAKREVRRVSESTSDAGVWRRETAELESFYAGK